MAYDLRLVFQWIDENLAACPRMSLSEMARRLKVERHTIERVVRKETGRSFRELQAERLLTKALGLLAAEPWLAVKEVSFLLGYSSPRAFRRFMRRTHGSSPTEARLVHS